MCSLPSHIAATGKCSSSPGVVCMLLCPQIWCQAPRVSRALLAFSRGQKCLRLGQGPLEGVWEAGALQELWVTGDAAAVVFMQAVQVTSRVSPWCPEARCTGGDHSDCAKVRVMYRKERRDKPSRQWCRHTVFTSGVLSYRMQTGKPKRLFHWTHFPSPFSVFHFLRHVWMEVLW